MTLHFETESHTHYSIETYYSLEGDGDSIRYVSRHPVGAENAKRGDDTSLRLYRMYPAEPEVGRPVLMEIGSLASLGPDDIGTMNPHPTTTTRHTTPVTRVWTS